MATYIEIQKWVKEKYGFVPKTCWIAHVKEISGLSVRRAHNRINEKRMKPCPENRFEPIQAALKHFRIIN
ncbi:MAG: hypothetical protein CVU42_15550 [Chloroflexi bacterium HGW-Chloroflexi-4]|nr:MAG: hypothetical protein CVV34_04215 [Methanomicrobiales archaeon HGW-Methanomicrobiales-5]PKN97596.1 MAG: hypothetical protein CVU42_15550 [Chloroflexi bacterium HGW-Chloroflexi-4]